MTVAFADLGLAIDGVGERSCFNLAWPRAEAHRAAEFFNSPQLAQFINHAMWGGRVELTRIGVGQSSNIAGKFNAGRLHA